MLVRAIDARNIASYFESNGKIDIMDWARFDITDAALLFEALRRKTWDAEKWLYDSWELPAGIPYAQLVTGYG